jgi:uncharacterized protein YndB with AHSA1/START domain
LLQGFVRALYKKAMTTFITKTIAIILFLGLPWACLSQNHKPETKKDMNHTTNMNISRVMDAPLEAVWNAWSNSESIKKWWGPEGFTVPVARMDFREGGVSLVCMRSPDGFEIYNSWTYTKIAPMQRIEFIQHFCDKEGNRIRSADIGLPPGIPDNVPHTILFKDLGHGQTEIAITEYGYTSPETAELSKAGMNSVLNKLWATLREK